jgi:enamine deaminase RidA (YjgF/YER057c/UK114 family)
MPHRYVVSGPDLPASPAPISQAVVAGQTCYLSGQLATRNGKLQSGSVSQEAAVAFDNLFAALAAAGFTRDDLVYVDLALIDLSQLPEVNAVFGRLFPEGRRPARTVVQAAALPYGGKIKVQAVAVRSFTEIAQTHGSSR